MISLWFALLTLALSCLVVSVVYALISPGDRDRMVRETATGFLTMFGGIILLAILVELIPVLLGK